MESPFLLLTLLLSFSLVQDSQQEQRLVRRMPTYLLIQGTQVHCANSNDPRYQYNCSEPIPIYNNDQPSDSMENWLEWKDNGSLNFSFQNGNTLSRIKLWYSIEMENAHITIPSFNFSFTAQNTSGLHHISVSGMSRSIDKLPITLHVPQNAVFYLSNITFYDNETSSTTLSQIPPLTTEGLQTTIITISIVLGLLLLLVACTLIGLICVVLYKKKSPDHLRRFEAQERNTYDLSQHREVKDEHYYHSKQHDFLASEKPMPPSDPEYATISEWREMQNLPHHESTQSAGVMNPFYAASNMSIATRSSDGGPPSYPSPGGQSSMNLIPTDPNHSPNLRRTTRAYSLQDVRSTMNKGLNSPNLRGKTFTIGSQNKVPRPLPPPRPVMRHTSMKATPTAEVYLQPFNQPGKLVSPLTQDVRAARGYQVEDSRDKESELERSDRSSVDAENYIIMSSRDQ